MSQAISQPSARTERFFTIRSILFSFLGLYVTAGLAHFHDFIADGGNGGTSMIGNAMPASAFFYLMFVGIGWNGLWSLLDKLFHKNGKLRDSFALSARELCLVLVVTLVSCFPPTSGLFRYFQRQLVLPWVFQDGKPSWTQYELLTDCLRPELFPSPWPGGEGVVQSEAYKEVYEGFYRGPMQGDVPFFALPLLAWAKTMLLYWGPLILLLSLSLISLQFLVHRQWAHHEQLSYPVAQVAGAFCRTDGGKPGVPSIFRNRLFWWGAIPVFLLLGLEYLSKFYPESVPSLSVLLPSFQRWTMPISSKIPSFSKTPFAGTLDSQTLYFTFLGIAYFVSSEIALTVGVSGILLMIFCVLFYSATGTVASDGEVLGSMRAGAYFGYTLILLYTGRTYFKAVFGRAFGFRLRKKGEAKMEKTVDVSALEAEDLAAPDAVSILAARVLVLAFVGFVIVLSWMCQSWIVAIFYALLLMVLYLGVSRIVCETGIPYLQANWDPASLLVGLVGPAAIGPKPLVFSLWSTAIVAQDPRESLIPYVGTGLKVADDSGVKLVKVFWGVVVAVIVALVVAWFASMNTIYNHGSRGDGWADSWVPQMYLDSSATQFSQMDSIKVDESTTLRQASDQAGPLERLSFIQGNPLVRHYALYGILGVLLLSTLRFRFAKFPIHPVFFLVIGTKPCREAWGAFLIGWFVKQLIVRFGGGGVYQKLKPLFIGLIVGEILIIGLSFGVDFLHYFLFDEGLNAGRAIQFLPG